MRTQKQIEANYTELIHAGEGITVEKGKISATGSGGSGGAGSVVLLHLDGNFLFNEENEKLTFNMLKDILLSHPVGLFSTWSTGTNYVFGDASLQISSDNDIYSASFRNGDIYFEASDPDSYLEITG